MPTRRGRGWRRRRHRKKPTSAKWKKNDKKKKTPAAAKPNLHKTEQKEDIPKPEEHAKPLSESSRKASDPAAVATNEDATEERSPDIVEQRQAKEDAEAEADVPFNLPDSARSRRLSSRPPYEILHESAGNPRINIDRTEAIDNRYLKRLLNEESSASELSLEENKVEPTPVSNNKKAETNSEKKKGGCCVII